MTNIRAASFFCDERITGSVVYIEQERTDKQMSFCEVGVFEETKRMLNNIITKIKIK